MPLHKYFSAVIHEQNIPDETAGGFEHASSSSKASKKNTSMNPASSVYG
jgi:hypothetical protein